ncbi:MAG: pyridoxamine 5'-phosphate oxidase family protein, partial [Myxococcales bacterium]|nr:pyridoxamine 5'-phosphate oxidase family protein [Myxococcales bacterium]
FVKILDDVTLLLPERPGNRLADTLKNLLQRPRVGLLFFVPGVGDSFRVNGRATLTTDEAMLAPCEVEGKVPKLGIIVDIEEAYTQCSKAFLRSSLWDPSRHVDRSELATNGSILRAIHGEGFDAEGYDRERAARYARREGFY